jgi:hypothetical protein
VGSPNACFKGRSGIRSFRRIAALLSRASVLYRLTCSVVGKQCTEHQLSTFLVESLISEFCLKMQNASSHCATTAVNVFLHPASQLHNCNNYTSLFRGASIVPTDVLARITVKMPTSPVACRVGGDGHASVPKQIGGRVASPASNGAETPGPIEKQG